MLTLETNPEVGPPDLNSMNIKHAFTLTVIILVALLGGIGYLLWSDAHPKMLDANTLVEDVTPTTNDEPTPTVVTAGTLAPKEIVRVWLQAWYQRDFATQYFFLAPETRAKQPEAIFVKNMQALPKLEGVRISNIDEKGIDDTHTDVTLTIEPDGAGSMKPFSTAFHFVQNTDGWKVAEIPVLVKPESP